MLFCSDLIFLGYAVACGKPVIAKVADVTSRGTAYLVVREYSADPRWEKC